VSGDGPVPDRVGGKRVSGGHVVLADSVTRIDDATGLVAVTGSHGGAYAAYLVAPTGACAAIFNDAGGGLDGAGVAGLAVLDGLAVPAATVSHESASIGDAASTLEGIVSRVNRAAARCGCRAGQPAREAIAAMDGAPSVIALPAYREARTHVATTASGVEVWALDSASLVSEHDANRVVVTGSHGALIGGRPETALKQPVLAAVFNDAGGGPDSRGRTRLPALDERGIAAVTVAAATARIGDGRSTLEDGVLSTVNEMASALGARPGQTTKVFVELVPPTSRR
jgi:hypothetical protein